MTKKCSIPNYSKSKSHISDLEISYDNIYLDLQSHFVSYWTVLVVCGEIHYVQGVSWSVALRVSNCVGCSYVSVKFWNAPAIS